MTSVCFNRSRFVVPVSLMHCSGPPYLWRWISISIPLPLVLIFGPTIEIIAFHGAEKPPQQMGYSNNQFCPVHIMNSLSKFGIFTTTFFLPFSHALMERCRSMNMNICAAANTIYRLALYTHHKMKRKTKHPNFTNTILTKN